MPAQISSRLRQKRGQSLPLDQRRDTLRLFQPVTDRGQIARPASIQRQARQCPIQIRHFAQRVAQIGTQPTALNHKSHGIEPVLHNPQIARRAGQSPLQQPRTTRRHGPVNRG